LEISSDFGDAAKKCTRPADIRKINPGKDKIVCFIDTLYNATARAPTSKMPPKLAKRGGCNGVKQVHQLVGRSR
jgi:hypothetical protein